jgi:arginyl-tRNA synthetase
MNFQSELIELLASTTSLDKDDVANLLATPPDPKLGDFAFPCFKLGKNAKEEAQKLQEKIILPNFIEKTQVAGPYLNFYFNQQVLAKLVLTDINREQERYGANTIGKGKTIVIDYSAPNIAKPFSIGHLRSTIIGQCLYNVHKTLGYKVVGVNHLGDWGTQFGKLIVAFQKWGNAQELKKDPIKYLLSLYVKFHKEAEVDGGLVDDARIAFKKLEEGDEKFTALWNEFKDLSLVEFKRIYELLGIHFDSWNGEAFYINKTSQIVTKLQEKNLLKKSEGALIIDLEEYKMPPILVVKSNGATTYHTRDLTTAQFRIQEYSPFKILYVVGSEQKLHFRQLFKALELLGVDKDLCEHVDFGLFRFPEGKMSTRKGNVIFLEDVLTKATNLALVAINEKNPDLKNKEQVAQDVGIGAIIFSDLTSDRVRNIEFNWERMLSFEGDTGPYLQYTHARACSILRKASKKKGIKVEQMVDYSLLLSPEEGALLKTLAQFPDILAKVVKDYKPHHIANFAIILSQQFNEFYHAHQVIDDNEQIMKARILLVFCTKQVLGNALLLLNMKAPTEM